MMTTQFRTWCREKWYEHGEELTSYGMQLPYTSQEYFAKYKFWLKREYRHEIQKKTARGQNGT